MARCQCAPCHPGPGDRCHGPFRDKPNLARLEPSVSVMPVSRRRAATQMIGAAVCLGLRKARQSHAAELIGLSPGMKFPDIVYRAEDGQTRTVGASRGKVSVVYFWAVWCPICYNDIVNVQTIYDHLKTDPAFSPIVLNIMDDYKAGLAWARARGITLPLGDSGMETRASWVATTTTGTFVLPRVTPQFHVIDRTGTVSLAVEGTAAGGGSQPNLESPPLDFRNF